MTREYETIRVERRDGLAVLTLDRPEAANTISRQLMADMNRALDAIDAEPDVRVLLSPAPAIATSAAAPTCVT